jgi:hypothetical protein
MLPRVGNRRQTGNSYWIEHNVDGDYRKTRLMHQTLSGH